MILKTNRSRRKPLKIKPIRFLAPKSETKTKNRREEVKSRRVKIKRRNLETRHLNPTHSRAKRLRLTSGDLFTMTSSIESVT